MSALDSALAAFARLGHDDRAEFLDQAGLMVVLLSFLTRLTQIYSKRAVVVVSVYPSVSSSAPSSVVQFNSFLKK